MFFTLPSCLRFPVQCFLMSMLMTLTCLDLSLAQAATPLDRESLRGLPGVYVLIEALEPDIEADGLSKEAIRTTVEVLLRSHGIRVLSQSESFAIRSQPALYVIVGTSKVRTLELYAVDVRLQLIQQVALVNRPQLTMLAPTWKSASIGSIGSRQVRGILNFVEDRVKEFANDFLAVNPR